MKMSVSKFIILLFLCCSCAKQRNYKKIEFPVNACRPLEIKTEFIEVIDLQTAMKNQELSRVYFYTQKQQMKNSIECYECIIEEFNR